MQFTLNNWYEWYYDDELFGRQDLNNFKKYTTRYNCNISILGTYKEELHNTARNTLEVFNGKDLTLCFSGGMDSEVVLRSYLEIGHPIKVVIYRYENNINQYDVHHAIKVCEQLKSPYKIIDFNLANFFETDAIDMIESCQIDKPMQLVGCKLLEITEGIPIMGEGDPLINVRPANDTNDKLNYYWAVTDWSSEICREQYVGHINKEAIPAWLQWRPEVVLACLESEYVHKLMTNQYQNVYSCLSNKYEQYSVYFPDIINREKVSGFENVPIGVVDEFKKHIIKTNGSKTKYMQPHDRTVNQVINELRGSSRLSK
jgi:Queuosine biosynthesis protein QueC